MRIGPTPPRAYASEAPSSADERATKAPDFTSMAKADLVTWGKTAFSQGRITLDDLFQIQYAGGDFDGTVTTDAAPHNFVGFFEGLIRNEIDAGRATDPQSMLPAYHHVLASFSSRLAAADEQ